MSNFKPVDSKREEYRKYLERSGVMECLTRILVSLYEEQDKGIDALEYVRNHLVENHPNQNASEEDLRTQIARLVSENNMLRKRLSQYEVVPPPISVGTPSKSPVQESESGLSKVSAQSKTSGPQSSPTSEKSIDKQSSTGSPQKK